MALSRQVAAWREAGRSMEWLGWPIFYRDSADDGDAAGDPVLCLHGFPTSSWDWHAVWPRLTRRHRLIAADFLGFGLSAKPADHDYTIAEQADLQLALLDRLGIDSVHVLAHDYGDTVAQELLARAERDQLGGLRIRSMILLNGGLFPELHRPRLVQKLLLSPIGPWVARQLNARRFAKAFSEVFGPETQPTAAELADYWSLIAERDGHRIGHRLMRYVPERVAFRERWVGALSTTDIPLAILNGPEDPVSGRHLVDHCRQALPHAEIHVLEGIGHYPQVEAPAIVAERCLDFVARHA